jgi:antitoxin (DNA-binding transcriptional repressor) of toxin-antitoxin stability system
VTITRRGKPVVTLVPVAEPLKVNDPEALKRIQAKYRALIPYVASISGCELPMLFT